ncbi:MAG: hypothetical protein D6820_17260 [Lentisphaerae bacterium]|nr:MAG: hypothetical protein D6820_17260 [Lentisphaerota bacterium]
MVKTLDTLLFLLVSIPLTAPAGSEDATRSLLNLGQLKKPHIPIARQWPADPNSAVVCLWPGGKTAAFSVTIDDNWRPDHAKWLALSKKYGWYWTWFVITGKVGTNVNFNGDWAHWQAMIDAGQDVQSHSFSHRSRKLNLPAREDYEKGLALLRNNLKNQRFCTLAYPGGGLPNDIQAGAQLHIGCRGTRGVLNPANRINYANTNSLSGLKSFGKPESHWASFAGMLNPKNRRKYRAWMCVHFHGLKGQEKLVEEAFSTIKKHEDEIWVGKFREVMMYGQERDTAEVTVSSQNGEYQITLRDRMDDRFFDFPLTIKWRLPQGWEQVKAVQNGVERPVTVITHDNNRYALIDIVPDRGVTHLQKR